MAHANARLNLHGRRLLVERVVMHDRPVAPVAKELGVSRQCAHRWVARFRLEGESGLVDRSSRPRRCPRRTPVDVEQRVLELRRAERLGQDWIGPELGLAPWTVSAILRRHQVPYLRECDPLTGQLIRASETTAVRYERDAPGDLVHMDVKKLGRIPDGGGRKAHGRQMGSTYARRSRPIGFDYVHSLVDDYSRLAYSEILPDEKGATCAGFLLRAVGYFAEHGIARIRQVMTDNHLSYSRSTEVRDAITAWPPSASSSGPTAQGRTARSNASTAPLQTEGAYREIVASNTARATALAPWIEHYSTERRHSALRGQPPTSRLS